MDRVKYVEQDIKHLKRCVKRRFHYFGNMQISLSPKKKLYYQYTNTKNPYY